MYDATIFHVLLVNLWSFLFIFHILVYCIKKKSGKPVLCFGGIFLKSSQQVDFRTFAIVLVLVIQHNAQGDQMSLPKSVAQPILLTKVILH
jgi:hypothetical protein